MRKSYERKQIEMKKSMMSLLLVSVMVVMSSIPAYAAGGTVAVQDSCTELSLSLKAGLADLELLNSNSVGTSDGFSMTFSGASEIGLFSRNRFSLEKSSSGVDVSIEVRNAEELQNFSAIISNKGYSIDYVRHLYTQQPLGSIAIYDETGEPIVATNKPVVYDADGVRVPSKFEVFDQGFFANIDYDGDVRYPLTVKYTLSNVSSFSEKAIQYTIADFWTTYYGHERPNGYCFTFGGILFTIDANDMVTNRSWIAVKEYFEDDPQWYNEEGLYDQYMCHADTGLFQQIIGDETWDIEPWRPSVGPILTMLNACNP